MKIKYSFEYTDNRSIGTLIMKIRVTFRATLQRHLLTAFQGSIPGLGGATPGDSSLLLPVTAQWLAAPGLAGKGPRSAGKGSDPLCYGYFVNRLSPEARERVHILFVMGIL